MPTSTTVAPGFTKSGVTNPGRPTAATRMSACTAGGREVRRPRVADGDGGVAMQQQERHRLADDVAASQDHRPLPGDLNLLALEHLDDAGRRARHELRPVLHQQPDALGGKPVDVLARRQSRRRPAARRRAPSSWAAATAPGCRRVSSLLFSRSTTASTSASVAVGGQPRAVGMKADVFGGLELVSHVDVRGGVFADEHDAEPRAAGRAPLRTPEPPA